MATPPAKIIAAAAAGIINIDAQLRRSTEPVGGWLGSSPVGARDGPADVPASCGKGGRLTAGAAARSEEPAPSPTDARQKGHQVMPLAKTAWQRGQVADPGNAIDLRLAFYGSWKSSKI